MKKLTLVVALALITAVIFSSCSPQIVYPDETVTEQSLERPMTFEDVMKVKDVIVGKVLSCKLIKDPEFIDKELDEMFGDNIDDIWVSTVEVIEGIAGNLKKGDIITVVQMAKIVRTVDVTAGGFLKLDETIVAFVEYKKEYADIGPYYLVGNYLRGYVNDDGSVSCGLSFEDFKPTTLDDYRNLFKDEK